MDKELYEIQNFIILLNTTLTEKIEKKNTVAF